MAGIFSSSWYQHRLMLPHARQGTGPKQSWWADGRGRAGVRMGNSSSGEITSSSGRAVRQDSRKGPPYHKEQQNQFDKVVLGRICSQARDGSSQKYLPGALIRDRQLNRTLIISSCRSFITVQNCELTNVIKSNRSTKFSLICAVRG